MINSDAVYLVMHWHVRWPPSWKLWVSDMFTSPLNYRRRGILWRPHRLFFFW